MAGRADGREARQGGGRDTRGEGEERSSEVPCRARRSPQARQQHVAVCTNCLLKEAAAPPPKLMADAPVPTATAEPKADAPVPSAEPKVDTPAPVAEPMPVGQVRFRDHCSCYAPFINDVVEVLELSRSARGLAQRTPFSASSSAPSSSASCPSGSACPPSYPPPPPTHTPLSSPLHVSPPRSFALFIGLPTSLSPPAVPAYLSPPLAFLLLLISLLASLS